MSGFVAMHRAALDHPVLTGSDRLGAWCWLIASACWKAKKIRIKGQVVELQRGQLSFSQRFLADKWGWSKSRVDRFIAELRDHGMIETCAKSGAKAGRSAEQGQSIITICNYDKYQDKPDGPRGDNGPQPGATSGHARGSSGAKKNKGNKGNNITSPNGEAENEPGNGPSKPVLPAPISPAKFAIDSAIALLIDAGRNEKQARTLIGKWRQTASDGQLIDAVVRAREKSAADPAAFIAQQIQYTARRSRNGNRPHDDQRDEPTNPFVRAALELQAERAASVGA